MFTWLVVVAIDYLLRATLTFSSLIISEKVRERECHVFSRSRATFAPMSQLTKRTTI